MQLFSQVCHRDVDMAIACFKSLEKSWREPWTLHLMEDGSVSDDDWGKLRDAFPASVFYQKKRIKDQIEAKLSQYPACLAFYRENVLSPKLLEGPLLCGTDFHFCDCDLLFFRGIKRLWPVAPGLIFLCEKQPRFTGFSHHISDWGFRRRIPLARNVNTGLFRIPKNVQDLDKIEWFLNWAHHPRYPFLVEQTGWAFIAGHLPHRLIAPEEIVCKKGALPEKNLPAAIHFIGEQKKYFSNYIPRAEAGEGEPLQELRTIPGRRVSWGRMGAHVALGLPGRIAQFIKSGRRLV